MPKNNFQISAVRKGTVAQIRVIGEIGWETDSEDFRKAVDDLISQGVNDVELYVNTPGGSCFDAAEIVNILSRFPGNVKGEGGAIVASAGTYIAIHCNSFSMPSNGQFMVHRPSGGAWGTATDLDNYIKLLKDIEKEYHDSYYKLATDKALFDEKWNAGDNWMTAQEAKDAGYITEVKPKIQVDRQTAGMIAACGCPSAHLFTIKNDNQMDVRVMAVTLGMDENSTEEQVRAKIAENKKKADDLAALLEANRQKEKTDRDLKIKTGLDKAIQDRRISAKSRAAWEEMFVKDFENASAALNDIEPLQPFSGQTREEAKGGKKTWKGKTYEELQDDPDALAELFDSDPDVYDSLFADFQKRNLK